MTKVSESADTRMSSMNAITEPIPRVVISASHPDHLVTAQLPVVRARLATNGRRELVRRPEINTRPRRQRASAPLALRISVTALLFVMLASASGVVAQRVRPTWFTSIERYIRPGAPVVSAQHAQLLDHAVLISSTPTAVTYAVPATSYSIVVTVDNLCWLIVNSPARSPKPFRETTLTPTESPYSIPIHGSSSIMVAARTRSITITEGRMVIALIKSPHAGTVYLFIPKP